MDKRHDDTLNNRLEQIITEGCTFISWNELYFWYDTKAIAAATYRDLHYRWNEIVKKHVSKGGDDLGKLSFVQSQIKYAAGLHLFGASMVQELDDPDA